MSVLLVVSNINGEAGNTPTDCPTNQFSIPDLLSTISTPFLSKTLTQPDKTLQICVVTSYRFTKYSRCRLTTFRARIAGRTFIPKSPLAIQHYTDTWKTDIGIRTTLSRASHIIPGSSILIRYRLAKIIMNPHARFGGWIRWGLDQWGLKAKTNFLNC